MNDAGLVAPLGASTIWRLRRLRAYKMAVASRFPDLPDALLDTWSPREGDALILSALVEACGLPVVVFAVRTFLGASAFHFAGHGEVRRVMSLDPNPTVTAEVSSRENQPAMSGVPDNLGTVRVLDIARSILAEFGEEGKKVELVEGVAARIPDAAARQVPVPSKADLDGAVLLVFLDGLRTPDAVQATLEVIYATNRDAIVVLDDCRYVCGPLVQAGVVAFMGRARDSYCFRLVGDLTPGLAASGLGVLFQASQQEKWNAILARVAEGFSRRLDPFELLKREEELCERVRSLLDELERARGQAATAQQEIQAVYRSWSWRLTRPPRTARALISHSRAVLRALGRYVHQAAPGPHGRPQ